MREVPYEEYEENEDIGINGVEVLDWRTGVEETLAAVDRILKNLGLEVVNVDTESDTALFTIEKLASGEPT